MTFASSLRSPAGQKMIYHKISLDFFSTKDKKLSLTRISFLCNEPSKKWTKYLLVSQQDMSLSHSGQNLCKLKIPWLVFSYYQKPKMWIHSFWLELLVKIIHKNFDLILWCTCCIFAIFIFTIKDTFFEQHLDSQKNFVRIL